MAFNSSKFVLTTLTNTYDVMLATKTHFEYKGYTIEATDSSVGFFLSLTKGGLFKSVLGMKTSLNVEVKKAPNGISIEAKVGIFGQQIVPSLIMLLFAWPVLITQIAGLVEQAKLDDEVVDFIENAIRDAERGSLLGTQGQVGIASGGGQFCVDCGRNIDIGARFCSVCGAEQ
ncbi:MAG: zinc ribbon domain-containing protein [Defluviitaleaceae bacterium]|nr:zinc ribbon domain-containing protein [Defluviitaleaceae bacterium]